MAPSGCLQPAMPETLDEPSSIATMKLSSVAIIFVFLNYQSERGFCSRIEKSRECPGKIPLPGVCLLSPPPPENGLWQLCAFKQIFPRQYLSGGNGAAISCVCGECLYGLLFAKCAQPRFRGICSSPPAVTLFHRKCRGCGTSLICYWHCQSR